MNEQEKWKHSAPPSGKLVEVRLNNEIIKVRAIYGDREKGILPHWESEDKELLFYPSHFNTWREIE